MNKRGVTLIELLIALVISAILVAGIYRVFISTQRSYTVQDQVVEMQQNVRGAINKMMREIRMVNFGRIVSYNTSLGTFVNSIPSVNGFANVLTTNSDNITTVGGFEQIKTAAGTPITVVSFTSSPPTITLSDATKPEEFATVAKGYLSIGGEESFIVQNPSEGAKTVLTLDRAPTNPVGHFVFMIQAVTYSVDNNLVLRRNENTGGGNQPMADNIEGLQFRYFNATGGEILTQNSANSVANIRVTITARTRDPDPTYGSDGGYRKREIISTIQLRNMGRGMGVP